MITGARLSDDGRYRYSLWRVWDPSAEHLVFIMLNPSTADAETDDPTIRRCIGFARDRGFGGIEVLNLYAFRATDPRDLFRAVDPVGRDNDEYLATPLLTSTVIPAWGAHAKPERAAAVLAMLAGHRVFSLGVTQSGAPRHPLYVRADQPFVPYPEVAA